MLRPFALLLAGLLPLASHSAESIDYSYIDGVIASRDAPGDEFEGLGLRGSLPVSPQFFLGAELYALSVDDFDRTDIAFGAGYHMPLNRMTDFVGRLDYVSIDTDIVDDEGLRVGAGVRSLIAKQLEVRGMVQYVDVGDGDLVVELGAQYMMSDAWAAFLEVSDGGDFGGATVGARLDF